MMRILTPSVLALLLLAAPVLAQEDACSQSEPCPWIVDVDEDGFLGQSDLEATVDDWYVLNVTNLDGTPHTLTLEGYDVTLTVPGDGVAESEPLQFDTPGIFELKDAPTGDSVWLEVRETDVVDDETNGDEDEGGDEENTPLPLAVGLVAVLAAAVLRRR